MLGIIVLLLMVAVGIVVFTGLRTVWRLATGYYVMRNRARFGDNIRYTRDDRDRWN
jgi:hypothetical protein